MKNNKSVVSKLTLKTMVSILAIAILAFGAVGPSLTSIISFSYAQMLNQTALPNKTKPETEKTIPKIANLSPGNNTKILTKDKNIGNPNSTLLKGMEKSQLGNVIPGNQGTTFEGQQLANLSANSSNSNSNSSGK